MTFQNFHILIWINRPINNCSTIARSVAWYAAPKHNPITTILHLGSNLMRSVGTRYIWPIEEFAIWAPIFTLVLPERIHLLQSDTVSCLCLRAHANLSFLLAALTKLVLFFLLALNPIPSSNFSAPLSDIEILVERKYFCAPRRPSKLPFQTILAIYYWVAVLTLLDLPPVDAWTPSKNSLL